MYGRINKRFCRSEKYLMNMWWTCDHRFNRKKYCKSTREQQQPAPVGWSVVRRRNIQVSSSSHLQFMIFLNLRPKNPCICSFACWIILSTSCKAPIFENTEFLEFLIFMTGVSLDLKSCFLRFLFLKKKNIENVSHDNDIMYKIFSLFFSLCFLIYIHMQN